MKTTFFTWSFVLLFFGLAMAQNKTDKFKTPNGTISVQPKLHSSMLINYNDITIAVDPYGGEQLFNRSLAPEIVLITDIHGDHLNMSTLELLNTSESIFIVPKAVANKLPPGIAKEVVIVKNGQGVHREGIFFMAIPMYNVPETEDSRHPKGRGNGYIIEIENQRIYISGDTSATEEMKLLRDIDIAFICMNLPYTMDVEEAADVVLKIAPKTVFPYHFRGKDGFSDVAKFKKLVKTQNNQIDVRLRDWYPEN